VARDIDTVKKTAVPSRWVTASSRERPLEACRRLAPGAKL
jgi:hypothetical protein